MNIKDLLLTCDAKELIAVYIEKFDLADENKAGIQNFIEGLLELEPIDKKNVLLGLYVSPYEEDRYLDCCLYHKKDLQNKEQFVEALDALAKVDEMSADEMEQFIESNSCPEGYSLLFVPWEEILGCEVSEKNVEDVGVLHFLAVILHEMTFFGYTRQDMAAEKSKLEEAMAEFKLAKEEGNIHTTSVEELFKDMDLQDDLEKEEELAHEGIARSCVKTRKDVYEMILDCYDDIF